MATVLWLVLQWGILPRIESWRPAIEQRASAALGVPVRIGAIQVLDSGLGWVGALELQQVVLLDARGGQEALRLPRVRATLSPTSLLPGWDGVWRLRFRQLLIDTPELDVRRDAQGRLSVAGLEVGGSSDGGSALADWFFSQPEFAIRGGRVQWRDALRDAPPLALSGVDLVVRNGVRHHAMRLDATPPADWGERFSLRGEFVQPLLAASLSAALGARPGAQAEAALPGAAPASAGAGSAAASDGPSAAAGAGRLLARPGDWRRWRGTVYADLPSIDLAPLQRHVTLPLEPTQGQGALRAWVDVQAGQPVGLTADLRLSELSLRLVTAQEAIALNRIDGRLVLRHEPAARGREERWSVDLQQLAFATGDGLDWPAGNAHLAWWLAADGRLAGGELSAASLDLGRLSQAVARLPRAWIGDELQARIADLAPQGEARQLEARWSGPLEAPLSYRVQARLQGLGLAAGSLTAVEAQPSPGGPRALHTARPGLRGADVQLTATEAGGEAQLALRDGELEFPGVFEQPRIGFTTLDTQLSWRITPDQAGGAPRIELRADDLRFVNADTQGRLDLRWSRAAAAPAGALGVVDLSGKLGRAEATRVPRYLPLLLGAGLRDYLQRALQGGHSTGTSFRLAGDLADFPFTPAAGSRSAPGEFRVAVQLEGLRFAFLPGEPAPATDVMPVGSSGGAPAALSVPSPSPWPAITDIQGQLVFDREAMQLKKLSGRLGVAGGGALDLRGVEGGIRDLGAADPVLVIDGGARGALADGLRFVRATPLGGWLGDALAQAGAAGGAQPPIDLKLGLTVPLNDGSRSQVRGTLLLAGNDLRLRPDLPLLGGARARIGFTESAFTLTQGFARVFGGETQFDAALQPDSGLRVNLQGSASAEGLRRTPELGALARAAGVLGGQTGYRLTLGVQRGQAEWQFSSSLAGLSVDLPPPFGKRADPALPLRLLASLQPVAGGGLPRDLLRVDLGPEGARLLQAQYLREMAPAGPRVLQGAISVGAAPGEAALPMAEGVSARLNLAQLDLGAWQRAAERLTAPATTAPVPGAAPGVPAAMGPALDAGYLPATLGLRAQELLASGHRLTRVSATVVRPAGAEGQPWKFELDAAELAGRAEYRPPGVRAGEHGGSVVARLARLSLPRGEDDAVSALLERAPAASVPSLDIVVEDFELRGKRLGRLEIEADNRPDNPGEAVGGAAAADQPGGEWQLRRLRLVAPDAQLSATGRWAAAVRPGLPRRTLFDFKLDVADGGALLARLGEAELVRGAKGRIAGQIEWQGAPLAVDYPSLSGQMTVDFGRGQFLQAEPGIAKLLGVLSLQALPRRLLLDFSDVFSQGFAFDALAGDIKLARGVAQTSNLRLRGVQAVVLMEGSADVARETQDLRVWIVPEVNAGTASLAYAAIHPAVGIGSFLAQFFLRRPLTEAGTREFRVTGPWAAPQVERMERAERRPVEPAPAASAALPGSPAASAALPGSPAASAALPRSPTAPRPTPSTPPKDSFP